MVRSGEEVLDSLFNNAINRELVPSILKKSRLGLTFAVIAAEFVGWEQVLENFKEEDFLTTAKLVNNVEKLAEPLYMRTKARPSDVMLKFYWEDPTMDNVDTLIPFGTTVQTIDATPIEYMTTQRAVLYHDAVSTSVRARSINAGEETMVPDYYLNTVNDLSGIAVTNPQASWGGRNDEPIESVRSNAMSARYSMVKGTESQIRIVLSSIGLERDKYNLVDNVHGYGSFGVYIDTQAGQHIREARSALLEEKAEGIYLVVDQAVPLYLDFSFDISVSSKNDLTPEERNNLHNDVTEQTREFIKNNGVGQKLIMSQLIHYLYEELLEKYNLYDMNIEEKALNLAYLDGEGNINIRQDQVIKIESIDTNIVVG